MIIFSTNWNYIVSSEENSKYKNKYICPIVWHWETHYEVDVPHNFISTEYK